MQNADYCAEGSPVRSSAVLNGCPPDIQHPSANAQCHLMTLYRSRFLDNNTITETQKSCETAAKIKEKN